MAPRPTIHPSIKHISRNEVSLADSIVLYFSAIQSLNLSRQCTVVRIVFLHSNSSNDLDSFNHFVGSKPSPEIRPLVGPWPRYDSPHLFLKIWSLRNASVADLYSGNQLCGHIPWYAEALAFCLDHAQLGWYELIMRGEKTYITVKEAVENASRER